MQAFEKAIKHGVAIRKAFKFCRRHSIPLIAKCDEITPVELDLKILQIASVSAKSRTTFGYVEKKEFALITRLQCAPRGFYLPLPGQIFTFSFQYKGISRSFTSRLLRIVQRTHTAIFRLPDSIYAHRFRESLRIPISPADGVQLVLGDRTLKVLNLTVDGMGVCLPSPDLFRIGQILPHVLVHIGGQPLSALAKIRHISKHPKGGYFCGMSLQYYEYMALSQVRNFIVKKQLTMAGVETDEVQPVL